MTSELGARLSHLSPGELLTVLTILAADHPAEVEHALDRMAEVKRLAAGEAGRGDPS